MQKKEILIVGGYGTVGSHISSFLSKNDQFMPVIAGRSEEKAKALAQKLNCKWKTIDLKNKDAIEDALKNVYMVISCFIPSGDFNTLLPEMAAEYGIHYLDVAAFNDFNERVTGINKKAVENNATLITALGLYPGMPGLIVAGNKDYFDKIDAVDIYFTSGGKMAGLSVLSLQGISLMMAVTPRYWNGEKWTETDSRGTKEYISEPFNKEISFFPFMITYDLLKVPEIIECNKIVMWSGTESLFQGLVFLLGMKLGLAKDIKRAKNFIKVLRFLGKNKNEDYSMKIVTKGIKVGLHDSVIQG
jgi:saccharopine dehydrogenase-like NADP-dependent oxidoreductase